MTGLRYFQVAAFAQRRFAGNPACVVLLDDEHGDEDLQMLARELAQPATAFLLCRHDAWVIRWFTPTTELPLCGHATLAAAWVLFEQIGVARDTVALHSPVAGQLSASRSEGRIWLDFPSSPPKPVANPEPVERALGLKQVNVLQTEANYLAVVADASAVRGFEPDIKAIAGLDRPGLIITARGDHGFDCVSRYFAPRKGVDEDAVTGSAHCTLAPYWCSLLGKSAIRAWQASARGGELHCEMAAGRVRISGVCIPFLEGVISDGAI